MSNIGLELALKDRGIGLVRCQVGDKYVMEELLKRNLALGGEQSGHVIFTDYLYTGDGLITALHVLRAMLTTGRTLADLADELRTFPQVLLNVPVRQRRELAGDSGDCRDHRERGRASGGKRAGCSCGIREPNHCCG